MRSSIRVTITSGKQIRINWRWAGSLKVILKTMIRLVVDRIINSRWLRLTIKTTLYQKICLDNLLDLTPSICKTIHHKTQSNKFNFKESSSTPKVASNASTSPKTPLYSRGFPASLQSDPSAQPLQPTTHVPPKPKEAPCKPPERRPQTRKPSSSTNSSSKTVSTPLHRTSHPSRQTNKSRGTRMTSR